MKNCNKLFALALAALTLAACGEKASIRGTLADGAEKNVIVKQLDINVYRSIDTLKTGKDGSFRYSLDVKKGQPEFIYLFYGDTRIAALLLEAGETAVVKADTLGRYSVEGSKGSADLAVVDKAYADFLAALEAHRDTPTEMTRDYIKHYRESVRYVMEHPYSLTTVPVFFEYLGEAPIFSQATDGILFRKGADSLKTVYPDSRYVKALEGVALKGIIESDAPTIKEYNPNHPLADENGYIYRPNVNPVEEMADMISANRSYQTAVQMATSAKKMMQATLQIGTNPNM